MLCIYDIYHLCHPSPYRHAIVGFFRRAIACKLYHITLYNGAGAVCLCFVFGVRVRSVVITALAVQKFGALGFFGVGKKNVQVGDSHGDRGIRAYFEKRV